MKYLRIDSQILTSISHCPLRCSYAFVERLVAKEENKAFAMGSAVHVANESYYNGLKNSIPFPVRYSEALATANTWMVTKSNLEQPDIDLVLKTLDEYYKFRKEDRVLVHEVEVPFSKVLYVGTDLRNEEITILYEGKIDLIGTFTDKEVVDHKTTSRNFPANDMTVQFLGYSWATGLPVTVNRIGFQTSLAADKKFKRFPFRFTNETISAWEQYAIGKALEYGYYLEEKRFPPNFSACDGKFGFPCNYINLCRYPALHEETKKFEFMIGEVWDPVSAVNT